MSDMKKIMGIDISSRSTGWSILQGDKLVEYGKVNPTGKMTTSQKLFLFHVELKKIIERHKPDEIAIEDVPLVKSVSVAKLLARFNGVAMVEAYRHLQKEPALFEPSKWKKLVEGCTGGSKKCEIQLAICKMFKLLSENRIEYYREKIDDVKRNSPDPEDIKDELKSLKKQMKKAHKQNDLVTISQLEVQIETIKSSVVKDKKKKKREMSNGFDQISMDIYTETSINEDIADSIGTAIALQASL